MRPRRSLHTVRLLGAFVTLFQVPATSAHGFGQRYDLPLPLSLWVIGAGLSIAISFAGVAWFLKGRGGSLEYPRANLLVSPALQWLAAPAIRLAARGLAVGLFVLVIVAGLLGSQDPFRNLVPTMVWVIWWVGLAFVCALLGDLWALLNPLRTLFAAAQRLRSRWQRGAQRSTRRTYPPALDAWPAVAFFVLFAWAELVWANNDSPSLLALALLGYACVTWTGMLVYGRDIWLHHAEVFSVLFALLARFAILEVRSDPSHRHGFALNLRPPAVGLLGETAPPVAVTVLVLTLLASVTFDGTIETPLWLDLSDALATSPSLAPAISQLRDSGVDTDMLLSSIGLATVVVSFVAIFWTFSWMTGAIHRHYADAKVPAPERRLLSATGVARRYVLTLVPIAIAYHLAHYLSMLLVSGQFIIPLLSDPFGFGWNLFGTAGYQVNLSIIGAGTVWYSAVAAVVVGHVCSVYLAHVTALRDLGAGSGAVVSQLPMMSLMVLYTMLSLWLLGQPIVG